MQSYLYRAVARTLIGGGGFIHIIYSCSARPVSFQIDKFEFDFKRNYSRAEHEYMNKHPPLLTF